MRRLLTVTSQPESGFSMKRQFQWIQEKILHGEAMDVGFLVRVFCGNDPIQKSPWWRNDGLLVSIMILL